MQYGSSGEHIHNKGHTIQLDYDPGSGLLFDETFYQLGQLHFHTPAEHHIDGVIYPMEMHLVHQPKGRDDVYLVVAVLYREGPSSRFIADFLAHVPTEAHAQRHQPAVSVDVNKAFTGDRSYYHYRGSLTTPPYTETVSWCVAKTIHTASRQQIERIRALEGDNARRIQPLHGRQVVHD